MDGCFVVQEMPARAIDDANVPKKNKHAFALRLGFRLEQFTQFDVTHILNHLLRFWTEWVK